MIEYMKKLGFSEYEIKTYFALLRHYPKNGYGLSKVSGVPRSRIYEVVEGLILKGVVFQHIEDNARLFTPLAPDLFMNKLKKSYDKIFEEVGAYTASLYSETQSVDEMKNVMGRHQILEVVKLLIDQASHRIALSIWDEELQEIQSLLSKKEQEGVFIRGIYFGYDCPFSTLISHRRVNRYIAEKEERYIIVIIDNKHVVSGVISKGNHSKVVWSQDPSDIDIKDDFIAHDVMINAYALAVENPGDFESKLDWIRKEYFCFSEDDYETFKNT